MRPETADSLAKARATLADAQQIATLPLPHVAAREAYYAAFHAAEAYIFEQTDKVATTHRVASITADQAAAAITTAGRFIDTISQLLPPGLTLSHGPSAQP